MPPTKHGLRRGGVDRGERSARLLLGDVGLQRVQALDRVVVEEEPAPGELVVGRRDVVASVIDAKVKDGADQVEDFGRGRSLDIPRHVEALDRKRDGIVQ